MSNGELVPAEGEPVDKPQPMIAGTFAVYATADGGFCLVTEIPGRGVEQRVISGRMVRMVTSGPASKMFGGLFGEGS